MMNLKSKFIFTLFFLSFVTGSFSQDPILLSSLHKNGNINISSSVNIYSSAEEKSIQQIIALPEGVWHNNKVSTVNLKISNQLHWMHFKLFNDLSSNQQVFVKITNKGINQMELFSFHSQITSLGKTGDHFSFFKRPFVSNFFIYPVTVSAKDNLDLYLLCDKRNENINTGIYIYNEENVHQTERKGLLYLGIFSGILLLAFIINIVLFFIFKERLNIWYSMYILAVMNMIMSFEGYDFEFLYPNHPFYASVSRFIASMSTLTLMLIVMQLYVKQIKNNSKFYNATNVFKWLNALMIPVTILIYYRYPFLWIKKAHFYTFLIVQFGGIIMVLASTIEKMIQKYTAAVFYFIAVVLLLLSGILTSFVEIGWINYSYETPNPLQWLFIAEVIIISTGILYRYQLIRKENQQLFDQLSQQKIESMRQILITQKNEQTRIAEDLHDLIGGQLAAIKLKLAVMSVSNKETINKLIDEVSQNTRNIAHNLIPVQLHDNALSDVVALHFHQINKEQPIQFSFLQTGDAIDFTNEMELDLYMIIMEITHNILKHSNATEATIQFFFNDKFFELIAEDNGKGIPATINTGIGINNIKSRVKKMNGNINIDSKPGNTTIIISIPLNNE